MPALAARTAAGDAALTAVRARLATEFLRVPIEIVARCVGDARARLEHLGITATPQVVERIAREHLLARVNSAPRSRVPR